jgi:chemotaxis protein CheX
MLADTLETPTVSEFAEPRLVHAISDSIHKALAMCGTSAHCVGVSSVPTGESGLITGLIGVHGKVSGFITVNMSERMAIRAVNGLLQDSYDKLTNQVVDGAGEITNIVVGGIKSMLAGSPWSFSNMTVPSVIIGKGYQIAYARGLEFINVTFEHDDADAVMLEDRLMQVSISLLKL